MKNLTSSATWKAAAGATITAGGLATGVTPGVTSTITATSGAISGTATLTVTNPLVSIAVTPPLGTPTPPSVAPGGTLQYTATGTYANGSTQNITSSVTWSASLGATISAAGLATGVTPNTTSTIMAAQGNISGTAALTITNPLVSIAVTPPTASIAVPFTQSFTATGTYADNSTSVITSTVTWASSAPQFATISNLQGIQGVATGVAPGTTSITATLGSVTSPPASLTVTNATLKSIAVMPPSASVPQGNQQQFIATGTFSDNSTLDITNSVTWKSSDTTTVSIVGSGKATGLAVTANPVTITASKNPGIPGTAMLSVTPPVLSSIAITPSTATLAQGTSRQYTATGTEDNGSTQNVTNLATWTTSDPTIATVGIHTGLVTAEASVPNSSNPVTITVSYTDLNNITTKTTLSLDVTNATVTSVTVTPIMSTIPVGVVQVFGATASFSDSSTQDVSSNASWTPSDKTVATVTPNFGRVTAVGPGSTNITATFGGQPGTAKLTVSNAHLQSIVITPASTVLAPASTVAYQALGHYDDGTTQSVGSLATWNSSDNTKVTISASGVATGFNAGSANITATFQSVTSNAAMAIVSPVPLVSISVTPATGSVPFGVSAPFVATGTFQDQSTQNLTADVTWAAGQSSVATISNAIGRQGVATGIAAGQTSITAVFAGIVGNAALNVTNATIMSIAVAPNPATAAVGTTVGFTAKGTFVDNGGNPSVVDITSQVTWSSSNATVATIGANGVANTASPGLTVITATFTQNGVTVTGMTNLTVQ